ncbi:putative methyltransferase TARBP1 [Aphomia sociella]
MSANNYIYIKKLIELKKAHSDIDVMDIVSLLDILDLDEEVIDARLRSIMVRDAHTNKQLASAIQLLQYKYLINKQENTECENNEEYAFIAKLINEIHSGNVQNICKIINVALSLNTITLVSKSEHLLQQILSNIDLSLENLNVENSAEKVLLNFQVCDSILDTALGHNEKICLPFLEMRVDNILLCSNERLKVHFLTNTVPKLFHCVLGFSVLDAIWSHLRKSHDDQKESALKILSSLSDYYLPVANYEGDILFESEIIVQPELWNIILFGLMSSDPTVRKIAIYVTKRTLDCIITVKKDILIKSEDVVLFKWVHKRESELKNMWDNYFILLESLEEKQSNIVLPSLQLFQIMNDIESHWLNCAFNIGLKHDNIQVRTKCIQYRLESKFNSQPEVTILLEALNDINIYEKPAECETLKKKIADLYDDVKVFIFVYKCIPLVKWSPVPLYHISNVLSLMPSDKMPNISQEIMSAMKKAELVQLVKDLLMIPYKAVLSMHIINSLHRNTSFISQYKHEMLNLDEVLKLTTGFENKKKIGRLTNALYENLCELVHSLVKSESEHICKCINDITDFIDTVLECGGYGCLIWVLRIMNLILPSIMKNEETFDLVSFIHRSWKEIEELKSNSQYYPCIEEFVALILQDTLLQRPIYNNIVILYCSKMIESGPTKNTPFFYLVKELNTKEISESYGQLVCVLSEILLYSPVPRKDQRIVENLIAEISQESKFDLSQSYDTGANLQIQYFAVSCLCKIAQSEVHTAITSFITKKIDEIFKNKQRYHGGSQPHRTLLIALQHLLSILLRTEGCDTEVVKNWCIELLGKLPHQPNVRVCLEWYIALCLYIQKTKLNDELLQQFTTKNVPLISQLVILHWVLKRKLLKDTCENNEYNYVMDLLLSHTMGQVFNIRLHSQYLSTLLHKTNECNSEKYAYTIGIIEKTFADNNNDKNYMKLKQDYFINEFDIVTDLTPAFIYYFLPKYTDILNECINMKDVKDIMKSIGETVAETDGKFHDEWRSCRRSDNDIFDYSFNKNIESKVDETEDVVGTIQKKYVPWKNMSDVHIYDCNKKKVERPRDLIVVASLIDKLPNLGGMARTSEVFGVKTYVVDSLHHLEDKQFQSLSVSAEKWIDVEEVRPGLALKQYLMNRKAEGYSVVAAEQTSNSCPLQSFKFPKKTLLLLGHEKEGVPCDLLPLMDHCVEIPQQGVVRSLNVHVTAAIFIWEYARQNIL